MILAVDVGNTETLLGLFDGVEPRHTWRVGTDKARTADELTLTLKGLIEIAGAEIPDRVLIASVVPVLDRAWEEVCRNLRAASGFLTPAAAPVLPIDIDVDEPETVGADRLANAVAVKGWERNTLVVDIGTAITFDCIDARGSFLGGVIAPGPLAGMEWLARMASNLVEVEIAPPRRTIGRTTADCLRSGVFYSIIDSIDGMVRRVLEEWQPADPLVVGTGGWGEVIVPHCATIERNEPYLTIQGLATVGEALVHGEDG